MIVSDGNVYFWSMDFPSSNSLDVTRLATVFNSTSATYKFYWFISLTEACEQGITDISKREMFARMLSNAWYTVNYFHVSFSSQDIIQQAIKKISETENIPVNIKKEHLLIWLMDSKNSTTVNILKHFDKNVPHWFLTPWIKRNGGENDTVYKKRIYAESQAYKDQALYALHQEQIVINPIWIEYLKANARILKDYCLWNLSNFLQVRNPSIPDIPGKLIKPPLRGSLTKQRKEYWDIVLNELNGVDCIYTNTKLFQDNYALDHFVPHAFVSHDLIWNLAPINTAFNSIKSDKLPNIDQHFDKFYYLQKAAYEIINHHNPKNRYLEEYLTIFPILSDSFEFDYQRYKETIQPLITIAGNNGFTSII